MDTGRLERTSRLRASDGEETNVTSLLGLIADATKMGKFRLTNGTDGVAAGLAVFRRPLRDVAEPSWNHFRRFRCDDRDEDRGECVRRIPNNVLNSGDVPVNLGSEDRGQPSLQALE